MKPYIQYGSSSTRVNFKSLSTLPSLEVVHRDSETQLQVTENWIPQICRSCLTYAFIFLTQSLRVANQYCNQSTTWQIQPIPSSHFFLMTSTDGRYINNGSFHGFTKIKTPSRFETWPVIIYIKCFVSVLYCPSFWSISVRTFILNNIANDLIHLTAKLFNRNFH